MAQALNWADVVDKDLGHVVLTKDNRLQVIVRPSKKQLRRRGQRGWTVLAALDAAPADDGQGAPPPALQEAILQALAALDRLSQPKPGKSAKKRKRRGRA